MNDNLPNLINGIIGSVKPTASQEDNSPPKGEASTDKENIAAKSKTNAESDDNLAPSMHQGPAFNEQLLLAPYVTHYAQQCLSRLFSSCQQPRTPKTKQPGTHNPSHPPIASNIR